MRQNNLETASEWFRKYLDYWKEHELIYDPERNSMVEMLMEYAGYLKQGDA